MKLKRLRQRLGLAGGTIVEALLAISTVGTIGSALIGSFGYGFHVMQLVRENQRATQIILEKVETVRLYSWDQVNKAGFIPANFTEVYDPQAAHNGEGGIVYTGQVVVTNVPFTTSYSTNLRQINITLSWPSASHKTRVRSLSTIVAKDGLQNYVY